MSEQMWMERAQSAEAKLSTMKEQQDRLKEDAQFILTTFGARKKSDGSFDINYQKFVDILGSEQALEVKKMIEVTYGSEKEAGSVTAVS